MPRLTGVALDDASTLRAELAGEDLALNLNGAAVATLTGTAGRVAIVCDGAGHVEIETSGQVTGQADGAAVIFVAGSPTSVDVKTEGAARVITK